MKKHIFCLGIALLLCGCNGLTSSSPSTSNGSSLTSSSSSSTNDSSITTGSSSTQGGSSSSSSSSSTNSSSSTPTPPIPPVGSLYEATIPQSQDASYYEPIRGLKGEALKTGLQKIIAGHKMFSYSSTTNTHLKQIDQVPGDASKVMFMYSGEKSNSTSFNKEHVWAQSHGDFGRTTGAGSDLHNLRPTENSINSTRGSLDFAKGGTPVTGYPGNFKTSSTFEPMDRFKGDIARTLFYMACRYDGTDNNASTMPALEISSPTDRNRFNDFSSKAKGVHGRFDDIYTWATSGQDPVDDYEVNRNNIIYDDFQNNRNPFIDHPEFIVMIYDKNYQGAGALNDLGIKEETPQEAAERVDTMILAIGTVTSSSKSAIEAAEKAYQALQPEAKKLVKHLQILQTARATYNQLMEATILAELIRDIDALGEITLASGKAILALETRYQELNPDQKAKITNYAKLVAARERYNELLEASGGEQSVLYDENFQLSSGASGSYRENVTLTLGDQNWFASWAYKSGEFRLGKNSAATLPTMFGGGDGSYLTMQFDVRQLSSLSFNISKIYGTVTSVEIYQSLDGGTTYESVYRSLESVITHHYLASEFQPISRYAFVVRGSSPRVVLNDVIIEGAELL